MTEKQKLIQRRIEVQNLLEYARCDGDVTGINQCLFSLKQLRDAMAEICANEPGRNDAIRRERLTEKLRKQL